MPYFKSISDTNKKLDDFMGLIHDYLNNNQSSIDILSEGAASLIESFHFLPDAGADTIIDRLHGAFFEKFIQLTLSKEEKDRLNTLKNSVIGEIQAINDAVFDENPNASDDEINNIILKRTSRYSRLRVLLEGITMPIDPEECRTRFVQITQPIKEKAELLQKSGHARASDALNAIARDIDQCSNDFLDSLQADPQVGIEKNYKNFRERVNKIIEDGIASEELKSHRGCKNILVNVLLGFSVLGLAFLVVTAKARGQFWYSPDTASVSLLKKMNK